MSLPIKKIWVVTPNFFPLWAGPSERFFRYAKISKQYGIEFSFVTMFREGGFEGNELEGVPVQRHHVKGPAELYEAFSQSLQERKGQLPDACIFLGLTPNLISINAKLKQLGIKSIYVSTMDFDLATRSNGLPRGFFRKILYRIYFKRLVNSFSAIVSSTSFLSSRYKDLGIAASKLSAISNGVNIERFSPAKNSEEVQALRKQFDLPDGLVFLFVGLLIERKGILELLQAWKAYKDGGGEGSLVLLGDEKKSDESSPAFYTGLAEMKQSLTNGKYQLVTRPASREVHQYFKACDVFVFLSKLEGMPNVLLEAMSSGIPILLHRFKGFSDDYGKEGVHFVSTSHAQKDIVEQLNRFATDGTLRQQLSNNSRALIEEKFQVSESIAAYRRLLD